MTTYVFPVERVSLPISFDCPSCGKTKRKRSFTVERTVNPFNKNEDGSMKSRDEVRAAARAEAVSLRTQFCSEPLCKACEDALTMTERRALIERRRLADNHANVKERAA